ncbi:unnamed protein product, partial [Mesorhabditis belari]|uniref:Saposin B-type domain-containing protein n=1 Tax=Mesorhabditis belari TaxID=2138241 RepID=A0AAF3E8C4_9BILA
MISRTKILFVVVFLISLGIVAECQLDNIMGCVFCQLITESIAQEMTPPHAFKTMYRRCAKMGLMEPVCDAFIEENAKKMFMLHKSGFSPEQICHKLALCQIN